MIFNQLSLNPTLNYQHISQQLSQLSQLLPPISPVEQTAELQSNEQHAVSLDHAHQDHVYLSSFLDYQPWLKHLSNQWYFYLSNKLPEAKPLNQFRQPVQLNPENTARMMSDSALHFTSYLLFSIKENPAVVAEKVTHYWLTFWHEMQLELAQQSISAATMEVIQNAAQFFQQHWLEYWLNFSELLQALPTNPTKNP